MKRTVITLSCLGLTALAFACSAPDAANDPSDPKPETSAVAAPDTTPLVAGNDVTDEIESDAPDVVPTEPSRPFVRITKALFEESPKRIEFVKGTWALSEPFTDGGRLGLVRGNTPITIKSHVVNGECETPWIEVAPRGFVCMEARAARKPKASKKKRKSKKRKRALIGSYAIAAKGGRFYRSLKAAEEKGKSRAAHGDMLRLGKSVTFEDGRTFRKTERGEYIESIHIRRLWGSKFAGVELPATLSGPVAFAVNARSVKRKVAVHRAASAKARHSKSLKPRSLVSILEISEDKLFARIAEGRWVERKHLREIDVQEPPAEVGKGVDTRWADVDLDKQMVVIYDGRKPVFATLISSGRERDRTPTGVFRVTRKKKRTTMRSDRGKRQTYSAAVPWSTYFHEGIAFHTAYWHDTFGKARSHGCVNLSPSDARTVYDHLGPEVPEGWSVVYGHESQLGSVVQVRSVRPNPIVKSEATSKVAVAE